MSDDRAFLDIIRRSSRFAKPQCGTENGFEGNPNKSTRKA